MEQVHAIALLFPVYWGQRRGACSQAVAQWADPLDRPGRLLASRVAVGKAFLAALHDPGGVEEVVDEIPAQIGQGFATGCCPPSRSDRRSSPVREKSGHQNLVERKAELLHVFSRTDADARHRGIDLP